MAVGCGGDDDAGDEAEASATGSGDGSATEEFKIGFAAPYTGPLARTGDEFKGAVELALEKIDSTIGPYKIEPVYVDETDDAAKAAAATEEAIVGQGIQAGCLNWLSSNAVAMMDVVAKHKVPWMFGFGATELVNEKFNQDRDTYGYWTTKGWPIPSTLQVTYADAVEDAIQSGSFEPSQKAIALAAEESDYGHGVVDALSDAFTERGWEVVGEEFFPLDSTNHTAILTKFKNSGASVVYVQAQADAMTSFLKQAQDVGLDALIIADGLGYVGEFHDLTGSASDYVLDQQPQFSSDEAKAFAAEFEDRFGFAPSASAAGLAYDWASFCLQVLDRAYEEYGELTSETIYKVMTDEVWTGELTYTDGIMMEEYAFAEDTLPDPVQGEGKYVFSVIQYFDGQGTAIYPPNAKEADLKAPGT
jgi:branched-chain amino acid transport system substrate-binding protein